MFINLVRISERNSSSFKNETNKNIPQWSNALQKCFLFLKRKTSEYKLAKSIWANFPHCSMRIFSLWPGSIANVFRIFVLIHPSSSVERER